MKQRVPEVTAELIWGSAKVWYVTFNLCQP